MITVVTEVDSEDNEERTSDVFANLLENRTLFIYDYIESNLATHVIAALFYLDSIGDSDIKIYINSEGGDLRSVFMIYDVMNMIKSPIYTICVGAAMNEAAILLAAGTPGCRFATKSSVICLSQFSHSEAMYSDLEDAKITVQRAGKDNKALISAIAKSTGKTTSKVSKDCERKLFLSAVQAKRYKLIDKVITSLNTEEAE